MDLIKTRNLLRREEGEVLSAYQDHLGYWTIGVGRLIDKRRGGGISPEESAFLLNNDIINRWDYLTQRMPWLEDLNDARKAVVLSMAFQMGVDGLMKFKTTLAHIHHQRWQEAHDSMLDSLWAKQTPARAKRHAEQMKTGEWNNG